MRRALSTPFIDTHHHLWDLRRFHYPWLSGEGDPELTAIFGDYAAIRRDYLIGDLLADYEAAGVVKSVHVQADISEPDPVVETRWLQGIADERGYPHAIIAYADLRSPDVERELDAHCESRGMRGIRMPDQAGLLADPSFQRGVRAMAARGLSLQADPPLQRMPELAALATALPDMRFFLGHAGFPERRTPEYFAAWRRAIEGVAAVPNVVVKVSGLGMCDHAWTVGSIRPWVMAVVEAFGVERCVFGTNWPVDRLYSDLPTLVDAYRTITAELGPASQDDLLWRNAERLYGI